MNDLMDLKRLAERAPTPRISPDLWQQGRRMRRRRHLRRAMACLAVLAIAITPAWLVTRPAVEVAAGAGDVVLPRGVASPHLWQATIDASPNGPVKLVFMHPNNIGFEHAPVFIGLNDSYRVLPGRPPDAVSEISPDGRWLIHRHDGRWLLLDTVEGTTRDLGLRSLFEPTLAWSRDGKYVMMKADGNDNLDDPSEPGDLFIYEVATGAKQHLLTEHTYRPVGAFSPSGDRVAITIGIQTSQKLLILDVKTGARLHEMPLAPSVQLLGPASWSRDGQLVTLAMTTAQSSQWRLGYFHVSTGTVTEDPQVYPGRPGRLVGWRDGAPVMVGEIEDPEPLVALIRLLPTGGTEVLLELPPGGQSLLVPQDLIERARFGGPPISPSVLPAQNWAYILVLVTLVIVVGPVLLIMRAVRRRRGRV